MTAYYTASHLAIDTTNREMDLLRRSREGYATQLIASGVKVERSEGAQSLKRIVGSATSRSIALLTSGTTQTAISPMTGSPSLPVV